MYMILMAQGFFSVLYMSDRIERTKKIVIAPAMPTSTHELDNRRKTKKTYYVTQAIEKKNWSNIVSEFTQVNILNGFMTVLYLLLFSFLKVMCTSLSPCFLKFMHSKCFFHMFFRSLFEIEKKAAKSICG